MKSKTSAIKAKTTTSESTAAGLPLIAHRHVAYVFLFLAISSVYLLTLSDSYFGLIRDGQMMFDTAVSFHEFGELGIGPEIDPNTGAVLRPDYYSKFGLGFSALLQLPLLAVMPVEKIFGSGSSNVLFPLANMLMTAVTSLLIALCVRDLGAPFKISVLAAIGYAFGTFAWPYISYDFSEPLQELLVTMAFWLLVRAVRIKPPSKIGVGTAGFLLGFAVLTKAALLILIPCFLYYAWFGLDLPQKYRWRYLAWLGAPIVVWLGIIAVLNTSRFGSPLDFGYGNESTQFTTPILTGLYGLILSPNKGLIFYAPITLLLPWVLWKMCAKDLRKECFFAASMIAIQIVVSAKWWSWEGGASWGPRLLLPVLPVMIICSALSMKFARRVSVIFVAFLSAGVVVNLLGILMFFAAWGQVVDLHQGRLALDIEGRPLWEYIEHDGKKWFLPSIATSYVPTLGAITGHGTIFLSRYANSPFPIKNLCDGLSGTSTIVDYSPLKINLSLLRDPLTISQVCSAQLWFWRFFAGKSATDIQRYPLYAIGLEHQGERATVLGKLDRAIDCFRRAASLMPTVSSPVAKLSVLLAQTGHTLEAKGLLSDFLAQYPTDLTARLALASVYQMIGDPIAALNEYGLLLRLQPDERMAQLIEERVRSLRSEGNH